MVHGVAVLRSKRIQWLVVTAGLTLAGGAAAQDIQGFRPSPGTLNYLSVDGARTTPSGTFVPSFYISYARNPVVLEKNNELSEMLIEDLTRFDLMLSVGIYSRVDLGLDIPLGATSGTFGDVDDLKDGGGFGDIRLLPKVMVVDPAQARGFGLALSVPLSFPTGDEKTLNTSYHFVANPKLVLEYNSTQWRIAANGGYRWRPNNLRVLEPFSVENGVTYGVAGAFNLGAPTLEGLVEVIGAAYDETAMPEAGKYPLEALAAVRLTDERTGIAFTLGGGAAIVDDYSAPEFRVLLGLTMATPFDMGPKQNYSHGNPSGDEDNDGVRNDADACPRLAEDLDGFQDLDGCPDLDNDQDGITDSRDRCPMIPAPGTPFGCRGGRAVLNVGRIGLLEKVVFDANTATLKPQCFDALNDLAQLLEQHNALKLIRIEAHTDAAGDDALNDSLSYQRAEAVGHYLIGQGIARDRLTFRGLGRRMPLTQDPSARGQETNRRVELRIIKRTDGGTVSPDTPAPSRTMTPTVAPVTPTPTTPETPAVTPVKPRSDTPQDIWTGEQPKAADDGADPYAP